MATRPALPYRVPRAPEWAYDRSLTPGEATVTDEDLDLETRIARIPEHSLDSFDPWVVDLG